MEVRKEINFIEEDLVMYKELDKSTELINNGKLLKAVESKVKLNY